uniref:DUF4465 domain-containing protein n=1 Tax=Alistipes sp. TaxID=1872444 RepID=UPI00405664DE
MRTKLLYTIVATVTALSVLACAPENSGHTMERYLCNFEGSYWNALVDNPQYMGTLLCSETPYSWHDTASDLASDSQNNEYDGVYYWGNGAAVSNYFTLDYMSASNYEKQLTVYADKAHSGKNCIVCTGYYSGSGDYRPSIYFKSKRSFIESMWIANTSYTHAEVIEGCGFAGQPLGKKQSIWIEAEGYVNDSEEAVAKAIFYLYKSGEPAFEGWKKWYLTSMCEVDRVKFNVKWDGVGDNPYPAYFAIDDITIVRQVAIK